MIIFLKAPKVLKNKIKSGAQILALREKICYNTENNIYIYNNVRRKEKSL